ncbi:MAG TPA: hypothetical protein VGJ13_16425 [Pseudonocardiaceae bacterium]
MLLAALPGTTPQAAGMGLLTPLGRDIYQIHPALPTYLHEQWRREDPDAGPQQRAAAAVLLEAYAALGVWLYQQITSGDGTLAVMVLDRQRRTLGTLLGNALDHGLWLQAQALAQPLNEYWQLRGLHDEARGSVDRARFALARPGTRSRHHDLVTHH